MSPLVSIVTPSHNKPQFVLDAIKSILNQTFKDYEYWIIENSTDQKTRSRIKSFLPIDPRIHYLEFDFTQKERSSHYIPAHILNQIYPELEGKYISYLSDDDLLMPESLQEMTSFMESNPDYWVCYQSLQHFYHRNGEWKAGNIHKADIQRGKDSPHRGVDCAIDGGQVIHKSACLKHLEQPFFPTDYPTSRHCDGVFLQKLADRWTFYPLNNEEPLFHLRHTSISTWTKP